MDTRRYTKRQVTWFRNQMKDWLWETPESALSAIQARLSGHK
jgi:tRNA A37 N6-isopentenylltransferase MiaA